MEWERAKSYILLAFLLLNAGLGWLLFTEYSRYTLDADRLGDIHTVLSQNNINLYTPLPRRFAPMRHLNVSGGHYEIPALLDIFFDGEAFSSITDTNYYLFETEDTRLEISNGFISFDNRGSLGENSGGIISRENALKISDAFIQEHFPDFVRDMVLEEDLGFNIIYRQSYRGQLIHSNYIEFFIVPQGIAWVEMEFGRVLGYSAETRMIFAPDEVLLTFMQRVRHVMDEPIFIRHMDIVYNQEYASDQEDAVFPAVPFYRIFIRGEDFPFLINAYTNVIL
ncbi:MAG: hypothetical protein FWG87_02180 [Defluviitaleaceae bacterium]|nr:hypothetical protein [Defluviitaleaceae bacterium]